VLEFTWKVFSQTGNIETYLLLKELETMDNTTSNMEETDKTNENQEESAQTLY
jgi:hypothetical protein